VDGFPLPRRKTVTRARLLVLGLLLFLLATFGGAVGLGGPAGWVGRAPLGVPRSEVAAAVVGGEIVVIGGFRADGTNSARVDAYSPRGDSWRRLRDLPAPVDHAAAAGDGSRVYVAGGYMQTRSRSRSAFVLSGNSWAALPAMPEPRAAAGAAFARGSLYVVGGVADAGLARTMLVLNLKTQRWTRQRGPTPREHLAVVSSGGTVYAIGGRRAGLDTNVALVEAYDVAKRRWRRLPPVPAARGGTDAAVVGGRIVSAGGEETAGTIASVYVLEDRRRWRRLPDLPTPRHGLAVVAIGNVVYAIAGGDEPGLTVTGANESLDVG